MAEDRIDSYIDLQATGKETEQFLSMLTELEQKFDKLNSIKITLGDASKTREIAAAAKQGAAAMDELQLSIQAYKSIADQTAKANARLAVSESNAAVELEKTKQATQARNRELKNQVAAEQSAVGSINQMRAELRALQSQYDALSAAERNSAQGQELLQEIKALDSELKSLEGSTGRFQRNVGNYSGAVQTLEKALQDVNKKLDDFTKTGQQNEGVLQALTREQQLLQTLVDAQSKGFASATKEIRTNQQAIMLLSQVYGEDSAVVKQLTAQTAELTDTVGDMRATIKAQASDTKVFDGLIGAAQGLMGIYTAAQGAAQLFGNENEELQKTFVKLQAAMAVLQGLQAIQNVLQKESAARQLVNIGLQKVATLQTNLQAAAESRNIIVRYAAIAAQKALNLVMSAAGGPLLAIIGLITLLIISFRSMATEAVNAAKSLDQLSAEFDRDLKTLENYSDFVKRNGDETIAALEAQFSSEADIRRQRAQNLRDQLQAALDLEREYGTQVEQQRKQLVNTLKKNANDLTEDEKKQVEQQDELIQKYQAQQKKRQDLATQLRIQIINNEKATKEESIKARQDDLEALKVYLQMKAADQSDIVTREQLYYKDRIAAAKEFQKLQERIINADTQKQLLTPGLTPSQIRLIETQRAVALKQIRKQTYEQILEIRQTYIAKEREQEEEANKMFLDDQEAAQQRLLNVLQIQQDYRFKNLAEGQEAELKSLNTWYQKRVVATREGSRARQKVEEEYEQRRADIEYRYAVAALKTQIEFAQKVVDARKAAGQDTSSAEKDLADLRIQLSDLETKHIIDNEARIAKSRQEKLDQIAKGIGIVQDLYGKTTEIIGGLIDANIDRQKNAIQQQIDGIDRKKEADIAAINASALTQQQKADQIAVIEAQAAAKKEELDRRQRELDLKKARFDRAKAIGDIIINTALAVVKALPNIPEAITVGAFGAAELAVALAQPLPQYKYGRDGGPAEWAITGDGGVPEVLASPDLSQAIKTPATDTLTFIPEDWSVFPDVDSYYHAAHKMAFKPVQKFSYTHDEGGITIARAVTKEMRSLKDVVKNKQETHIHGTHASVMAILKYGNTWINKIDKKVNF